MTPKQKELLNRLKAGECFYNRTKRLRRGFSWYTQDEHLIGTGSQEALEGSGEVMEIVAVSFHEVERLIIHASRVNYWARILRSKGFDICYAHTFPREEK